MPTLRTAFLALTLATFCAPAVAEPVYTEKRNINAAQNGFAELHQRPEITPRQPDRVAFANGFKAGSIVIDTAARKLYFTLSASEAYVYPVAVGKPGFAWTGVERVTRIADWPQWTPPADMRQRNPKLPEQMLGGMNNPLGARAIYLGNTDFRIHGTNKPASIGTASSSGCIRMLNGHVVHLAGLVSRGTRVFVLEALPEDGPALPPKVITSATLIKVPMTPDTKPVAAPKPVQVASR